LVREVLLEAEGQVVRQSDVVTHAVGTPWLCVTRFLRVRP